MVILRQSGMERALYLFLILLMSPLLPASEIFFCSDGPLRIREKAGLEGRVIGRLQTFEYALVEEVDPRKLNIDGLPGSWIRIRKGDDRGWVYGGYGIILKDRYPVNEIADLIKIYPSSWSVERLPSYLMSRNGKSQIILQFFLNTGNDFSIKHDIYISLKERDADLESLAAENGLKLVRNASDREVRMGMGREYQVFRERGRGVDTLSHLYDERILYFQSGWDSSATTDIAAYLSEGRFDGPFKGIMFCYYNLWPDARDPAILDIDNPYIREARERGELKSLYYQIILEIMKRVEIGL